MFLHLSVPSGRVVDCVKCFKRATHFLKGETSRVKTIDKGIAYNFLDDERNKSYVPKERFLKN